MRVFFSIRKLYLDLTHHDEDVLPLTPPTTSSVTGDVIDTGTASGYTHRETPYMYIQCTHNVCVFILYSKL